MRSSSQRRSSARRSSRRLRANVRVLPRNLTIPEARKDRAELLASLSDEELALILWINKSNNHLFFGSMAGGSGLFVLRAKRRNGRDDMRRDEKAGTRAVNLVKRGWLRLSPGPDGENGYFWLSDSAETVMQVLAEKAGLALLEQRGVP